MNEFTNQPILAPSAQPLAPLIIENLVAGYEQRVLLRNLFLCVPGPSFVAIVGHNGCGKSTLFRALTGQLSYQGSAHVFGRDLRAERRPVASGLLAHLPQRNTVSFPIEVRELVVMGRFRHQRLFSAYGPADYALADAALQRVGAAHLAHRDFTLLSGGEQQLVWLAQLALQDARLYLLDEPTQQLDVYYRRRIFDLLQNWVQESGKTVLCITHDLDNLPPLTGYLLNLSLPQPQLEALTPESVRGAKAYLESEESLHINLVS